MTNQPDPLYELLLRARPGELGPDVVAKLLRRPVWHDQAACRDAGVDAFFLDKGESMEPAMSFCSTCPVIDDCRQAGEAEHGIWGATSMRQRQREARVIRSSGRRPAAAAGEAA